MLQDHTDHDTLDEDRLAERERVESLTERIRTAPECEEIAETLVDFAENFDADGLRAIMLALKRGADFVLGELAE